MAEFVNPIPEMIENARFFFGVLVFGIPVAAMFFLLVRGIIIETFRNL